MLFPLGNQYNAIKRNVIASNAMRTQGLRQVWLMKPSRFAVHNLLLYSNDYGIHGASHSNLLSASVVKASQYWKTPNFQGQTEGKNEFYSIQEIAVLKTTFGGVYDEKAIWIDDLPPAFGEDQFFFEKAETEADAPEVAMTS